MESVGRKLKKARLEKNITLEEAYRQTKIHSQVLEALEEDRAHNFLSPIYIKGFLKKYAQFLGLNSEQILKEYFDSQKKELEPEEMVIDKKYKIFPGFKPFAILRILLGIILIFIFVVYLRFVTRRIAEHQREIKKPKVEVTIEPKSEVKIEDLILEVETKDACWIRVKADGETIFQKTLPKGKRERWQAKKSLELLIGKPEALEVFFNGEHIDLKKAKLKKTLIITHEGIEVR